MFLLRVLPTFQLTLSSQAHESLDREPREFVRGSFRFRDQTLADVGIRFKGHRSMRGWSGKPAFKIRFDKYERGARFLGLRTLTLNNMVEDPTMLREWLSFRLFRKAGVPAPRSGYALVEVNGEAYGLYAVVESIDSAFLVKNYRDPSGNLYEGEYGCDLYPEDVAGFDQDGGDDESREDLAAFARQRLAAVDRPRFLSFLAVSALVGDFDGYRHGHNYRIYREPNADQWSFIPWGQDRAFKRHLPIYDSQGLLAQLCFADPACRVEYVAAVQNAVADFEALNLAQSAEQVAMFLEPAMRTDPRKPYTAEATGRARAQLQQFLSHRAAELREQTACLANGAEVDADGDGVGCGDCADDNPAIHPGAEEVCDGIDNNCSGRIDDAPSCGCPEVEIEGATFALCDLPMSWPDAEAFCRAAGKQLARIDSAEQAKALYRAARKQRRDRWWIGLSDRATEGDYRWTDDRPAEFTYWAKGEPDTDGCSENCVALKDRAGGHWHDTHCAQHRPFICR